MAMLVLLHELAHKVNSLQADGGYLNAPTSISNERDVEQHSQSAIKRGLMTPSPWRICMARKSSLAIALAVFVFFVTCPISGADQASREGKLVVQALIGDNNTPSKDAFVYVRESLGQLSLAVSPTHIG